MSCIKLLDITLVLTFWKKMLDWWIEGNGEWNCGPKQVGDNRNRWVKWWNRRSGKHWSTKLNLWFMVNKTLLNWFIIWTFQVHAKENEDMGLEKEDESEKEGGKNSQKQMKNDEADKIIKYVTDDINS